MTDVAVALERFRAADPVPAETPLPSALLGGAALLAAIDERNTTMVTKTPKTTPETPGGMPPEPRRLRPDRRRRRPGLAVAVTAFVAILLAGGLAWLIAQGDGPSGPADPTPPTVVPTPAPTPAPTPPTNVYPGVQNPGYNVQAGIAPVPAMRLRFDSISPPVHLSVAEDGQVSDWTEFGFAGITLNSEGPDGFFGISEAMRWFNVDTMTMEPFTDLHTAITGDVRFDIGAVTQTEIDGSAATRIDASVLEEHRCMDTSNVPGAPAEGFITHSYAATGEEETWGSIVEGCAMEMVTFWIAEPGGDMVLFAASYQSDSGFLAKAETMLEGLEFEG